LFDKEPGHLMMHQLFEQQAAAAPDNIALVFADQAFSYQALNEAANRLAHYLRSQGVGAGSLVGICVDRSADIVIGILAILKAGGAYVPLDPSYPQARIEYIAQQAQFKHLLTQQGLTEHMALANTGKQGICEGIERIELDSPKLNDTLSAHSTSNPTQDVSQGMDICHFYVRFNR
jgi:non-ribosomal peptide synthetase component F